MFLYFCIFVFVAPVLQLLLLVGGKGLVLPTNQRLGRAQKRVYCLLPNFFCHCSLQLVTHIWCATTKNLVRRAVQSTLEFQLQLHKLSHTSVAPRTFSTSSCNKKIWCAAHSRHGISTSTSLVEKSTVANIHI